MERAPTAAVYYHPDGFHTDRADLMGRHVAGATFLSGLARHHMVDPLVCFTSTRSHAADFAARVRQAAGRPRPVRWIALDQVHLLGEPGCVFLPGPGVGKHAWRRRFADQRLYSLCGVTHTLCTMSTMDDIGDFLIAPVQPWDALVCTSTAARRAIDEVLGSWTDYLADRFGARPALDLQLPVIPLGVHCGAFDESPGTAQLRRDLRARHGIADDEVALLFAGRLSFASKAHPVPMWLGAERAARRLGRRLHLLMAGQFARPDHEAEFRRTAAQCCPSVTLALVDGGDSDDYRAAWFAADIFVSLSDNIQETFGLTPVEAMAAGLPAVVSDWDGYRDTVVHGETGFRIPTCMPPANLDEDLARRFATEQDSYERHVGAASLATAVDLQQYTDALVTLAQDAELRRRMGAAARRRAVRLYDWSVVIERYEALWGELAALRAQAAVRVPRKAGQPAHPLRADPFTVFAGFVSESLGPHWCLRTYGDEPLAALEANLANPINFYAVDAILPPAQIREMAARIGAGGALAGDLVAAFPAESQGRATRTLLWLMKMGIVQPVR